MNERELHRLAKQYAHNPNHDTAHALCVALEHLDSGAFLTFRNALSIDAGVSIARSDYPALNLQQYILYNETSWRSVRVCYGPSLAQRFDKLFPLPDDA